MWHHPCWVREMTTVSNAGLPVSSWLITVSYAGIILLGHSLSWPLFILLASSSLVTSGTGRFFWCKHHPCWWLFSWAWPLFQCWLHPYWSLLQLNNVSNVGIILAGHSKEWQKVLASGNSLVSSTLSGHLTAYITLQILHTHRKKFDTVGEWVAHSNLAQWPDELNK